MVAAMSSVASARPQQRRHRRVLLPVTAVLAWLSLALVAVNAAKPSKRSTSTSAAATATKRRAGRIDAAYGAVTVIVSKSGKSAEGTEGLTAEHPQPLSRAVRAYSDDNVHVAFAVVDSSSGSKMVPRQAVLRLHNRATGAYAYFAAKSSDGNLRVSLDVSNRAQLGAAADGGTFEAVLLLGDSRLANPTEWRIGEFILHPPAPVPEPPASLYSKPLLHESDTTLTPLKEIEHQFRPAEQLPAKTISIAFAGLTALPWVFFVGYVFKTQLPMLPWSEIPLVHAVIFHGSLLAILALYGAYWMGCCGLNMFGTLLYLVILAIPASFSGNRLMRALLQGNRRLAEAAKKTK